MKKTSNENYRIEIITNKFLSSCKPGKGYVKVEEGFVYKDHENEYDTAFSLLNNFGGEIEILKEKNFYNITNPDYKWNRKFWELKSVSSSSSIDNAIRKAYKQILNNPGGVIIDIRKSPLAIEKILSILSYRLNATTASDVFVIIKSGFSLVDVVRYKKEDNSLLSKQQYLLCEQHTGPFKRISSVHTIILTISLYIINYKYNIDYTIFPRQYLSFIFKEIF